MRSSAAPNTGRSAGCVPIERADAIAGEARFARGEVQGALPKMSPRRPDRPKGQARGVCRQPAEGRSAELRHVAREAEGATL